jgi:ribosome biogenesis GTPase A
MLCRVNRGEIQAAAFECRWQNCIDIDMLHLFRARPAIKLARSFSHRAVGIVGMPNIGKSTLFNALTRTQKAQAANYVRRDVQLHAPFFCLSRLNYLN